MSDSEIVSLKSLDLELQDMSSFVGAANEQFRKHHRQRGFSALRYSVELTLCRIASDGHILAFIPLADVLLAGLRNRFPGTDKFKAFGESFSACRIRVRSSPYFNVAQIARDISARVNIAQEAARQMFGCELIALEYIEPEYPVFPEMITPDIERYHEFADNNPEAVPHLLRVASGQVQVLCVSFAEAILVHNRMITAVPEFVKNSWCSPERIAACNIVTPGWIPAPLSTEGTDGAEEIFRRAQAQGSTRDSFVDLSATRVNVHNGTVDFSLPKPVSAIEEVRTCLSFVSNIVR